MDTVDEPHIRETMCTIVARCLSTVTRRYVLVRHLSSTVGKSKSGEDLPTFQYVGKRSKRKDRVFVWGFSYTGALGIPSFVVPDTGRKNPKQFQLTPYRLDMDEKISSAACGYGFSLLSSKTTDITKVWGMGLNKDSQIGFHRSRRDRTKGYEYILEPSPVPLPLDRPQETRVLQVSCGRAHSLILTDNEGVKASWSTESDHWGAKLFRWHVVKTTVSSGPSKERSMHVAGELMAKQALVITISAVFLQSFLGIWLV